jgi:hypothetical protein
MMLNRKDISIGIDGEQWIFTTRIKTNTASRIPLLPIARDILEKYSRQPDIIHSGRLLPKLVKEQFMLQEVVFKNLFAINCFSN